MIIRTVLLLTCLSACQSAAVQSQETPRNVVFFIADGTGPATYTLAREYRRTQGTPKLAFDGVMTGSVETHSASSRVTDSAAAGTALATGVKTNNGAIGVDAYGDPVRSVLEEAEARGMATGLVSTARVTHATPASFAAHVASRSQEEEIALQIMAQNVDVILGGGRDHFLPREAGGSRSDGRDLLQSAVDSGWTVVSDSAGLASAVRGPVLGLFDTSHMDYELDRRGSGQPSLAFMTRRALELLEGTEVGFFLMIEAGRIDHAGHDNDIASHLHDLLAYEQAMAVALDYARRSGNTLVVATSDHETGGLSLARAGVYEWYPEALGRITTSVERMVDEATDLLAVQGPVGYPAALMAQVQASGYALEARDVEAFGVALAEADELTPSTVRGALRPLLQQVAARQAGIDWTTTGHTGVDVPLFAFGPGVDAFRGTLENDEVGRRLIHMVQSAVH